MPQKVLAKVPPKKLEQLFFLILLLGLIPAIANYSLFGFVQNTSLVLLREDGSWITSLGNSILTYVFPMILLPLGALICIQQNRYWGLLAILPFIYKIATLYELSGDPILHFKISDLQGFLIYQFSFFYFIIKGTPRSKAYYIFLVIIFFLLGLQSVIVFLGYTLVARVIYLVLAQNLDLFKDLGWKRVVKLFFRTFLYWSPLLIFIIPSEIVSTKIYNKAIQAVYDNTFVDTLTNQGFEADVDSSVNVLYSGLEEKVLAEIEAQRLTAGDDMDAFIEGINKGYDDTVPNKIPGMDPQKCTDPLTFIPCGLVVNPTKSSIQHTVDSKKKDGAKKLNNSLQKRKNEANASVDDLAATAKQTAIQQVNFLKESTRTSAMLSFRTVYFLNLLMDISLIFIILKSFFYVFARVAFSEKENLFVTLRENPKAMPKGEITKTGNQYTIDSSCTGNYFISRAYEPSGRPPRFYLPQWGAALLARLRTKTYFMNRVDMDKGEGAVYFRSMGGAEFVEWKIQEGEAVIFKLKNFVAMSEGIQLTRKISLRLTSLLMGRIFFSVAKGPGTLILMTDGKPITSEEAKASSSIATNRIVAWQKHAAFNVQSELNVVDIFLSGIHLQKKDDDLIIIDADMKGGSQTGIVTFIKAFLLPI